MRRRKWVLGTAMLSLVLMSTTAIASGGEGGGGGGSGGGGGGSSGGGGGGGSGGSSGGGGSSGEGGGSSYQGNFRDEDAYYMGKRVYLDSISCKSCPMAGKSLNSATAKKLIEQLPAGVSISAEETRALNIYLKRRFSI